MRPKFETIMEDVDVYVGETSRLAVVVEGKPDPDILWYKVRPFSSACKISLPIRTHFNLTAVCRMTSS